MAMTFPEWVMTALLLVSPKKEFEINEMIKMLIGALIAGLINYSGINLTEILFPKTPGEASEEELLLVTRSTPHVPGQIATARTPVSQAHNAAFLPWGLSLSRFLPIFFAFSNRKPSNAQTTADNSGLNSPADYEENSRPSAETTPELTCSDNMEHTAIEVAQSPTNEKTSQATVQSLLL